MFLLTPSLSPPPPVDTIKTVPNCFFKENFFNQLFFVTDFLLLKFRNCNIFKNYYFLACLIKKLMSLWIMIYLFGPKNMCEEGGFTPLRKFPLHWNIFSFDLIPFKWAEFLLQSLKYYMYVIDGLSFGFDHLNTCKQLHHLYSNLQR